MKQFVFQPVRTGSKNEPIRFELQKIARNESKYPVAQTSHNLPQMKQNKKKSQFKTKIFIYYKISLY